MEWPVSWEDVKNEFESLKPITIDLDELGVTNTILELMVTGGGTKSVSGVSTAIFSKVNNAHSTNIEFTSTINNQRQHIIPIFMGEFELPNTITSIGFYIYSLTESGLLILYCTFSSGIESNDDSMVIRVKTVQS